MVEPSFYDYCIMAQWYSGNRHGCESQPRYLLSSVIFGQLHKISNLTFLICRMEIILLHRTHKTGLNGMCVKHRIVPVTWQVLNCVCGLWQIRWPHLELHFKQLRQICTGSFVFFSPVPLCARTHLFLSWDRRKCFWGAQGWLWLEGAAECYTILIQRLCSWGWQLSEVQASI